MMPIDRPNFTDTIKLALEYAKEASERTRKVIVLLMIASIITFIAWWNEYQHGWTQDRMHEAQDALQMICEGTPSSTDGAKWAADSCVPRAEVQPLSDERKQVLKEYLSDWRFSRKQLERHIQDLQDQMVSGVLKINMPFFGLTSDVNDLGILAGIAFLILLAILLFTIWREEQNVFELFQLARKSGELPHILDLFSMTQVFTIPPQTPKRVAQLVTAVIYSMPVLTLWPGGVLRQLSNAHRTALPGKARLHHSGN